jgi:hypothetical protein
MKDRQRKKYRDRQTDREKKGKTDRRRKKYRNRQVEEKRKTERKKEI